MSAVPVQTYTPPKTAGKYPPNGDPAILAHPFYAQVSDVISRGLDIDWVAVDRKVAQFASFMPSGVTSLPSLLENVWIPDAEAMIDQYCKQTYKPTQYSRFFDGDGSNKLLLPFGPILSLDKLSIFVIPSVPFITFQHINFIDTVGPLDDVNAYPGSDLLVYAQGKTIEIPAQVLYAQAFAAPLWDYTFLLGQKNIEVVWTYGFGDTTAIPSEFTQAVAAICKIKAYQFLGSSLLGGLAQSKIGDSTKVAGREKNMPYADLMAALTNEWHTLMVNYKSVG